MTAQPFDENAHRRDRGGKFTNGRSREWGTASQPETGTWSSAEVPGDHQVEPVTPVEPPRPHGLRTSFTTTEVLRAVPKLPTSGPWRHPVTGQLRFYLGTSWHKFIHGLELTFRGGRVVAAKLDGDSISNERGEAFIAAVKPFFVLDAHGQVQVRGVQPQTADRLIGGLRTILCRVNDDS